MCSRSEILVSMRLLLFGVLAFKRRLLLSIVPRVICDVELAALLDFRARDFYGVPPISRSPI